MTIDVPGLLLHTLDASLSSTQDRPPDECDEYVSDECGREVDRNGAEPPLVAFGKRSIPRTLLVN